MTRWTIALVALAGGLVGGGAVFGLGQAGGAGTDVRTYLLAHPEVIPEAMQKLQDREAGASVAANRPAIVTPFASAWAGNPKGDVTLVEYYDYNCGYCRASLPMIHQLIERDPKLRVVFRELPILADTSRSAARISLVAALQGKFTAFHDALYAGGRVSEATIAAAAKTAGVDPSQIASVAPKVDAEIAKNMETAARLGVSGTPAWVVGDRILSGALPIEELERAIAAARSGAA
ncbi:disulfide bond formation protein DsbA [Sphingomonas sp. Leaf339]|uniref:DsbA family protein n=1 Tax=Sphingomonas sp. Leaf339 TaxID=1736343 RepID=UPI0006FE097E|nr:DsbA family protein [Sphingomonas sp. Leaf339]KQU48198.1 disulfide bond formation protein DsbA [Sphingomonas sp. Leaf339]